DVQARLDAEAAGMHEVGVLVPAGQKDDGGMPRSARLAPPRRQRLRGLGVAPQAGGFAWVRDRLEEGIVAAAARPAAGAAVEVEPFLDLVPAGVGDFVAQVAQLSEVAAQRPLRHARAFGEL